MVHKDTAMETGMIVFAFNNISTFRSLHAKVKYPNSASRLVRQIKHAPCFPSTPFCVFIPLICLLISLPLAVRAYVDLCRLSFTRERGKRELSITRYAGGKITTRKLNNKNQDIPPLPDTGLR